MAKGGAFAAMHAATAAINVAEPLEIARARRRVRVPKSSDDGPALLTAATLSRALSRYLLAPWTGPMLSRVVGWRAEVRTFASLAARDSVNLNGRGARDARNKGDARLHGGEMPQSLRIGLA